MENSSLFMFYLPVFMFFLFKYSLSLEMHKEKWAVDDLTIVCGDYHL